MPSENAPYFPYDLYESLHFIDPDRKDPKWGAEVLRYSKLRSNRLLAPEDAVKADMLEEGRVDEAEYKKIIDPPNARSRSGGDAPYYYADYKANPVYLHLNKVVDAGLEKIPRNLILKATDEFAQSKKYKENQRILGRKYVVGFMNYFNRQLGLPTLNPNADPYKVIQQNQESLLPQEERRKRPAGFQAPPIDIMDSIKAAVEDNEDIQLFNEYVYKDGAEIAVELGMNYYNNRNKFDLISQEQNKDLRKYGTTAMRFYTSQTTGEPVLERLDPRMVYVSDYSKADLSDIKWWYIEYKVTFGDFVRMFGANLDKQQLRMVFERNQSNGASHGLVWEQCGRAARDNAYVLIGYFEFETQNIEVYAYAENIKGNMRMERMKFDYQPRKNSVFKRQEKHYNCWYKFYYIPQMPDIRDIPSATVGVDSEQWKYLFEFGKLQDQLREGDDYRYSKSSLIATKIEGPTFAEIMDRYMKQINISWFSFQNNLANQMPNGNIYAWEAIQGVLKLTDDAQKNGTDAMMEFLRRFKQTGSTIMATRDPNNPQSQQLPTLFQTVTDGHKQGAFEDLRMIQELYAQMTLALGINDIREGMDPKPRQSFGGVQLALQASNNSTWYLEYAKSDIIRELGNRYVYYFKALVEDGDSDRLRTFESIVGQANAMAWEAVKDIPLHTFGFFIDVESTEEERAWIQQYTLALAQQQQIEPDVPLLIRSIENPKYAYALLRMKLKQRQRQIEQREATTMQAAQAQQQQLLQIQASIEQLKVTGRMQQIELEERMKTDRELTLAQLKQLGMMEQKRVINENKKDQDTHQARLSLESDAIKEELKSPTVTASVQIDPPLNTISSPTSQQLPQPTPIVNEEAAI